MIRDNAEELASIPQEIKTQVVRGLVRNSGGEGGLHIGDVDIEELLYELKNQEVLVIVAPLRPARALSARCGLCGMPYAGGDCPVCEAEREEAKRVTEESLLFGEEPLGLLS